MKRKLSSTSSDYITEVRLVLLTLFGNSIFFHKIAAFAPFFADRPVKKGEGR